MFAKRMAERPLGGVGSGFRVDKTKGLGFRVDKTKAALQLCVTDATIRRWALNLIPEP